MPTDDALLDSATVVPAPLFAPFLVAVTLFMLIPGPAMVHVLTETLSAGRETARRTAVGLALGRLVLGVAVVAGVAGLVAASTSLLTVVKILGALYLLYLGVQRIRTPMPPLDSSREPVRRTGVLRRGVLVSASNPKEALFLVAFLPQFLDPAAAPVGRQLAELMVLYTAVGLAADLATGIVAGALRGFLLARPRLWAAQRWTAGLAFVGFGLAMLGGTASARPR